MRYPCRKRQRRGASMVEAALVLSIFVLLILGMLDLSMAVHRSNVLSEAARQGARQAMVHGSLAPDSMGRWGSTTYGPVAANDSNPIAQAIQPYLVGLDPSTVMIAVEWLDGTNKAEFEGRVRVTLTHTYHPITLFLFNRDIPLSASSTMPIAH